MRLPETLRLAITPKSITRSLFLRVGMVVLLGMVLITAAAATAVSSVVNHGYDAQLRMGAHMMVSLMSEELASRNASSRLQDPCNRPLLSAEDRQAFADFARWRMFRVWYGGKVCWSSQTGPDMPMPTAIQFGKFAQHKATTQTWRYYTYASSNGPVVQVGEKLAVRRRIVAHVVLEMIAPFVLIVMLLVLVLLLGVRRGLRGLSTFNARLAAQNDRPPFHRLSTSDAAQELHPLVEVVNRLFERIEGGVRRERKFIDMAAHELRTPLAGLSIEAQLAARADDADELRDRLAGLNRSTHRIKTLVDQLLALANAEAIPRRDAAPCALSSVLGSVIADLAPIAARRGIEIAVESEGEVQVAGDESRLQLLLSNLIDNALKHTPDGGEVLIVVEGEASLVRVSIIDDGPGMSDADKALAFERFWRAPGNNRPGTGLGLAIVQEAATALGAQVTLHDRIDGHSGLRVVVIFAGIA